MKRERPHRGPCAYISKSPLCEERVENDDEEEIEEGKKEGEGNALSSSRFVTPNFFSDFSCTHPFSLSLSTIFLSASMSLSPYVSASFCPSASLSLSLHSPAFRLATSTPQSVASPFSKPSF